MEMVAPLVTAAGDVTERDTRDGLVTSNHHLHVADTQAQARSRWAVRGHLLVYFLLPDECSYQTWIRNT